MTYPRVVGLMESLPYNFMENKGGVLHIHGVSALDLTRSFGTPLYVICERRIRDNYRRLLQAMSKHYEKVKIFYSAKANTSLSVLRILNDEGASVDTVSPGEIFLALKAGFEPNRILFTGTNVRDDELKFVFDSGVMLNIDSMSQLHRLLKIDVPKILSFRVNPEVGAGHHEHVITAGKNSKFGIWEDDVIEAYTKAYDAGVRKFGAHMHIGSGVLSTKPFLLATERLLEIVGKVRSVLNLKFDFIDIGGGLGIPYEPEEKPLNLYRFAEEISELLRKRIKDYDLGEPSLYLEPGRFIVSDSTVLLTTVNTIKVTPFKKFAGVDAGFNTLIRPAMYDSYHHMILANKLDDAEGEIYDIAGPICESGDLLARDRCFPEISEGDIVAILNAGAYGFSMSSQYNSRPRCAEILVREGESVIVRQREEMESLLAGQNLPPWLH